MFLKKCLELLLLSIEQKWKLKTQTFLTFLTFIYSGHLIKKSQSFLFPALRAKRKLGLFLNVSNLYLSPYSIT